MKKSRLLIYISLMFSFPSYAQIGPGMLSGSFQSKTHYYLEDSRLNILQASDPFASNNYLWLQYSNGPVSMGLQYESYMPPLQGYPYQLEGNTLSHKYLRFKKDIIDITVGNYYEQFGSGLSFRSYEERALGINNSLDGFRIVFTPLNALTLKALYGLPRLYLEKADAYVRGLDLETDFAYFFKSDNSFRLGVGVLSRYSRYLGPEFNFPETVTAINARSGIDIRNFSFEGEYVSKSSDPDILNSYSRNIGRAVLTNATYTADGLGVFISARLLSNMNFLSERDIADGFNNLNYIPSNSRQYSYMLSNLYPYTSQAEGELSIQADINYTFKSKVKNNRSTSHSIRYNYAYSSGNYLLSEGDINLSDMEKYYSDLNLELKSKWSRKVKTNLAIQNIYFNRGKVEGHSDDIIKATIVIADATLRLPGKTSLRSELQHLWSNDDHGNWYAILAELNIRPSWSFFASNMTDYEYSSQVNYYNFGISYSSNQFRLNVGYGLNREGYICAGGVCRKIPAYKGFNFSITSSF